MTSTNEKKLGRLLDIVEEHGDVLPLWVQAGFNGKEIIIFDRHLDYKYIPKQRIEKAKAWSLNTEDQPPIRDLPFRDDDSHGWGIDDFLWIAAELGLMKSLVWVMPTDVGSSPEHYGRALIVNLERIPHIGAEVLSTFTITETHAEVRTPTLFIRATSINHLSNMQLSDDAHIDFDLDFFVSDRGIISHSTTDLILHFPSVRSRGPSYTACYSESTGFIPHNYRHLAQDLAGSLICKLQRRPSIRLHFPATHKFIHKDQVTPDHLRQVIINEAPLMGASGHSLIAEIQLSLGDIHGAVKSIELARDTGDRATIASYKLALYYMKQGHYKNAIPYLEMVIEERSDSIAVHALKLILISNNRLGKDTLDANLVKHLIETLPHNLGILELLSLNRNPILVQHKIDYLRAINKQVRKPYASRRF
jgi:hypothetical protein